MNKQVKYNKSCSLFISKYIKIGRRAKGLKKYRLEDGRMASYLEFDNIGLEFIVDDTFTYMRDLKSNVALKDKSRFEDFQKCIFVIIGYSQTHSRAYK